MSSIAVFFSASAFAYSSAALCSDSRTFFRWRLYVRKESQRPSISMMPTTATRTASAMSDPTMRSVVPSRERPLNTLCRGYHRADGDYVGESPRARGASTDRNAAAAVKEKGRSDLAAPRLPLPCVPGEEDYPAGDRTDPRDEWSPAAGCDRPRRVRARLEDVRAAGRFVVDEAGPALDGARRDARI